MGLDMYLKGSRYIGSNGFMDPDGVQPELAAFADRLLPPDGNLGSVVIERDVAYWRKANQIHAWFVANVQDGKDDCGSYPVSVEQLRSLYEVCQQVLNGVRLEDGIVTNGWTYANGVRKPITEVGEVIVNPEIAEQLLPTQGGFFFGSTDYDQWYVEDLKSTIEQLDRIFAWCEANKTVNGEHTFYPIDFEYHSSW